MKQTLNAVIASLLLLLFLASCHKDKGCKESTESRSRSINLFDTKSTSIYYNQVVANFKFLQTSKINSPYDSYSTCTTPSTYPITLSIQNLTAKKMIFDYNISFNINLISWNYQGVATIPAGGSLDVGEITNNSGNITLGSFIIQSVNIVYQ
jgi:hypothetical protein